MKMTSLVKKNEVPYNIVTDPDEVAMNMAELNCFRGIDMSVLLHDDNTDIELVACHTAYDLPFYVAMSGLLAEEVPRDCLSLLRVKVADPTDLPYEMDSDEEAFIIYDEWDYRQFFDMEDVASTIEQMIRVYKDANIEQDFVVLIGQEMNSAILDLLLERADKWKEQEKVIHSRANRSP